MVGAWMADRYKGKKIAFVHDKSTYGKGLADQIKANMNAAGVHEILYEGINPGEKGLQRHRRKAESGGGRSPLLRRLSNRGRPHSAPGGRPGGQIPDGDDVRFRDARILGDRRGGWRRNFVPVCARSGRFGNRQTCRRRVPGGGFGAGRLHLVQLRDGGRRWRKVSGAPAGPMAQPSRMPCAQAVLWPPCLARWPSTPKATPRG